MKKMALCASICLLLASTTLATPIRTFDFETEDDFATPLVHGQLISTVNPSAPGVTDSRLEFGNLVSIRSTQGANDHAGAAIFDSNLSGTVDPDLEVGLGNILILQNNEQSSSFTDTGAAASGIVFDDPNDDASSNAGSIIFDFVLPIEALSVDIVDANGGFGMNIILTDADNLTRTYIIPEQWSRDIASSGPNGGSNGFDTLSFTTLADQEGEGIGGPATASEDAGFDSLRVSSIEFQFTGTGTTSGGIDNLTFVPEPTTAALVLLGVLASLSSSRRRAA